MNSPKAAYRLRYVSPVILSWLAWILFIPGLNGQPLGNEWITYDQKYFRFPVAQSGVYRITHQTLQSALSSFGFQISDIPPGNFQVWERGAQLPLYVSLGNDGAFNAGDYVEFYARGNDGWLDAYLYASTDQQVNPAYSLFTDTATCYFSWNATGNNSRFTPDTDTTFMSYISLPYILSVRDTNFPEVYLTGPRYPTSVPDITLGDPKYTGGEGWSGNKIWVNQGQTRTVSLPGLYLQGPPVEVSFTLTGGSNRPLQNTHLHARVDLGSLLLLDTLFPYFTSPRVSVPVPVDQFAGGSAGLVFSNIQEQGQILQEWLSVSALSLVYPRNTNIGSSLNQMLMVPDLSTAPFHYLRLSGFSPQGGDSVRLLDLVNHRTIRVVQDGPVCKALVRNFPGEELLICFTESQAAYIGRLVPVDTVTASFTAFHDPSLSSTADYLIITHPSLAAVAQDYADYRSTSGYPRTYHSLVAGMDQLADQFAYGVKNHPLAVRNFVRFVCTHYSNRPEGVFLIGKSFQPADYRNDNYKWNHTLVPTFGNPPSDWLMTDGINAPGENQVPVGRLSASVPADVLAYLSKVTEFEERSKMPGLPDKLGLQFGGGNSLGEQYLFRSSLAVYDSILASPHTGMHLTNFFKNPQEPVYVNQTGLVKDLIERQGIRLINYFGHASGISFDHSIGDPADFDNAGKYYFVLANSCWAGDLFDYHGGLSSERYVLLPGKGAIAYLASVTEGEVPYLHAYTSRFYHLLGCGMYGETLGKTISGNIRGILQDSLLTSFGYREVCHEMTLHGDPALVLFAQASPDFTLWADSGLQQAVSAVPAEVTAEMDSFLIRIVHVNLGKAYDSLYFIRVSRSVAGSGLQDTLIRVRTPLFRDTLLLRFPVDPVHAVGLNTFTVTLDAFNEFDEAGPETNNTAQFNLFIRSADLIPVIPPQYAVVAKEQISLKAFTAYPFTCGKLYAFQLDTAPEFNSPLLKDTIIFQAGGIIAWNTSIPLLRDSLVCFWRCRMAVAGPDSTGWHTSSFQYVPGKQGWGQAHFRQMDRNGYRYVQYLTDSLTFGFVQESKTIAAQTYITGHPWQEEYYRIDNNIRDVWNCAHNRCSGGSGIKFAVFNPVSLEPWESRDLGDGTGPFGNKHCKSYPVGAFDFCNQDPLSRQLITEFLDMIPQGYHVLGMSHKNHRAQQFEESVYQAFESIGSQMIRQLSDTSSYIIFGRKGAQPGEAAEIGQGTAGDSLLKLEYSLQTNWKSGTIHSTRIGPSAKWQSLHWRVVTDEKDSVRLGILGITPAGVIDTLLAGIPADSGDLFQLGQWIDAGQYPWLELLLSLKDTSSMASDPRDPAILKRWQVLYEPYPETSLDPQQGFSFYRDTLEEGDTARLTVAFHNIGDTGMDSLKVAYWLTRSGQADTLAVKRLRPHPAGDVLLDSIAFPTLGRQGLNQLWVDLNPGQDQPELTHINNTGEIGFYVLPDNLPPWLEVWFDDVKIRDMDYVSPAAGIRIRLTDENPYRLLTDTAVLQIWLGFESEVPQPVWFSGQEEDRLTFSPAVAGENRCMAFFQPDLTGDGVYTLRVRAFDAAGNIAGEEDYVIRFRVMKEQQRTELLAFPNPFRSYTRFGFLLAGDCVPDDLLIRITDLAGRVVGEIGPAAFGELQIGTNLSRSVWEGCDSHGNRLANGLYIVHLYLHFPCGEASVSNQLDHKYIDFSSHRQGKVVIMR